MKEFSNLELCRYRGANVTVIVNVSLSGGVIEFSGQDIGQAAEDFWGDDDYEYWYTFDEIETVKLLSAIDGMDSPEDALLREFSGEGGCRKLHALCAEHGIHYKFFSY